ncbi:hypothetical protein, partial [Belliella kenyensis]|uniref:hypothetical protein n=1 Tax=Belliella kenyensis TaxID=1472724 RepID=UPI001F4B7030
SYINVELQIPLIRKRRCNLRLGLTPFFRKNYKINYEPSRCSLQLHLKYHDFMNFRTSKWNYKSLGYESVDAIYA